MIIIQRVLEARLAEKVSRNPALAKDLGIVVTYRRDNSALKKSKDYTPNDTDDFE